MPIEFSLLRGEYLSDILDQPHALQHTLAGLAGLSRSAELRRLFKLQSFKTVVLTGIGASLHALHPLHLGLTPHGLRSVMVETSELIRYHTRLFDSSNLIIAVSQSGQSAEVIRLLETNRRKLRLSRLRIRRVALSLRGRMPPF